MPSSERRFRPTTPDDLDFVLALEADEDTRPFIAPWTREEHAAALDDPDVAHWIIDAGGPVGFVILRDVRTPRVEFRRIAVAEKGRGHGRWALEEATRVALEERGAGSVWLDVLDFNERARRLYESAGYRVVASQPSEDAGCAPGAVALVMEITAAPSGADP